MAYNRKDFYFHEAKKQNYAARSIFKLEEIDARFRLIKPGMKVLDLGAAPGSWSQFVSKKIGPKGRVLGIDLQPIRLTIPNAEFVEHDFTTMDWSTTATRPPFDMVISDMAPRTTGIRISDQARSLELCQLAWAHAATVLLPKGHFICKLFDGGDAPAWIASLKKYFGKFEILRPKSTRKESKEVFLIGISYAPQGS
jgi:23S rRNA (uridine2552-2'-O)-methyltransferase